MPLFSNNKEILQVIKPKDFKLEKDLQSLVESNLEEIFSCKFIDTEFSTGDIHSGRIDTLAISEENNPVIIEYKIKPSSSLLNQSLFYLAWLKDHKGDFEKAVRIEHDSLEVDWSNIRIICIAPGFAKYDLHAVKEMNSPIELWQYKLYENNMLNMEKIYGNENLKTSKEKSRNTGTKIDSDISASDQEVEPVYPTYEEHYNNLSNSKVKTFVDELREYLISLSVDVEELPRKYYMAYKISKNFCCLLMQKDRVPIFLRFADENFTKYEKYGRDVSNVGHHGTGNFETILNEETDMKILKEMIKLSFENIGG